MSLFILFAFGQACDDDGFKETKSGSISFSKDSIAFPPVTSGSEDVLIEVIHGGERAVVISAIYLGIPDGEGGFTPVEGCDRITEGVDPSTQLTADVLPTCTILITERPTLPLELDNNSSDQVKLTYRPLLEGQDPSQIKLVVESNATNMYQESLDISVIVSTPELNTERVISFASSGESTEYHLVRNSSTTSVIVDNVRIERNIEGSPAPLDPANDMPVDEFEILPDECGIFDGSCVLNFASSSMSIPVRYRPFDEVGPDKATMFIEARAETGERLAPIEVLLTTEDVQKTLTITPNPLVFNPPQNQEGRLEVSFVNGGLSSLAVYQVSFEPEGGPFTLRGAQDSFSVQGGGAYALTAFWLQSEVREGTMVVETDADNAENGVIRVPISVGSGGAVGLLTSDTSNLSFDGVAPEESLEQTVTLTSNGMDAVSISELRIDGDSDVFEVVSGGELTSLDAGDEAVITVRFTRPPADPGTPLNTYAGTLVVVNDSLGGDVTVNLSADPLP